MDRHWTALMIGNSRLHWAMFIGEAIVNNYHHSHGEWPDTLSDTVYFASVVPELGKQFSQQFPHAQEITLADIPLPNLYPTLGIDRALAVFGASHQYGFPCLVIDGGTALTFTGINGDRQLVGGAILPGLRLQFHALVQDTAALPHVQLPEALPPRWAQDTPGAIASGIVYTVIAGIQDFVRDWQSLFPQGTILVTGGDGAWLQRMLAVRGMPSIFDPDLVFKGFQALVVGSPKPTVADSQPNNPESTF